MATASLAQTWTLRGTIDAQCGTCGARSVEIVCEVVVEGTMVVCEDCPEPKAELRMRMVDGERPVEFRCVACGAVTKYGDVEVEST